MASEKKIYIKRKRPIKTERKPALDTAQYYVIRYIAMIAMVIDHVAYLFAEDLKLSENVYTALRTVGRISFPLFCYLLVESFFYTKNKKKHFQRILLLAFASEIPFNMFKEVKLLTLGSQNVCFELAAVFLFIWTLDQTKETFWFSKTRRTRFGKSLVLFSFKFDVTAVLLIAVTMLNFDYAWRGLLLAALLWASEKKPFRKVWQFFAFSFFGLSFLDWSYLMMIAVVAIVFLAEGNFFRRLPCGKKVNALRDKFYKIILSKWSRRFCRVFYPLHLVILVTIRLLTI